MSVCVAGAIAFFIAVQTPMRPFLTEHETIEWGMPFSLSLITFFLLFISTGSLAYIFGRLWFEARSKELKVLSSIIACVSVLGSIAAFLGFVVLYGADIGMKNRIYAIGQGLLGVAFIIGFWIVFIIRSKKNHRDTIGENEYNKE